MCVCVSNTGQFITVNFKKVIYKLREYTRNKKQKTYNFQTADNSE